MKARPSLLALVHVRLPPGYSPSFAYGPKMGTAVHRVFYRRGVLLLAVKQSDNQDYLWMVDPDLFPFQQQLTESRVIVPVDGRVWYITESPDPFTPPASDLPLPPGVVTQHADAQRQFVMLTAQGSYTFTKLKQVDQLRYLLEGRNEEEIAAFFHLHKVGLHGVKFCMLGMKTVSVGLGRGHWLCLVLCFVPLPPLTPSSPPFTLHLSFLVAIYPPQEAQACAMSLILATDGEDQVSEVDTFALSCGQTCIHCT